MSEAIINDHYYDKAREFIQEHVKGNFLSEEVKTKFAEYYQSLNAENAKHVYEEVSKLYSDAVAISKREFNMGAFQFALLVFAISGGVSLVGTIGDYFIPKISRWHRYSKYIQNIGFGGMIAGVCLFFAIGH